MSNTSSNFTVLSGRAPNGASAMEGNFEQKAIPVATLIEGMIVAVEDASGTSVVDGLTSGAAAASPDYPWVVIQGMDQWDSSFVDKVTCLATKSGLIFKVDSAISVVSGDFVYANAGVLAKITGGANKQAVGQVLEVDASGFIVIAT